jgi:hypothetical protein
MRGFPFERHRIAILTVERPSKGLQATLRRQRYTYVCDHGLYGDQMWIDSAEHAHLMRRAQRHALQCEYGRQALTRCEPIGDPGWRCGGHGGVGATALHTVHALANRVRAQLGDAADH